MRSLQRILKDFGTGLARVASPCYHYWRMKEETPYCIWQEDGEENSFNAGNRKTEQQIHGTVDYFTRTEYDPTIDDIQDYFDGIDDFGWSLLSVQYEDETNIIHYEWEWWMV